MTQENENHRQWIADWATEKKLIACDLHDGLIQLLVGSKMQLDSIALERDIPDDATRKKIETVKAYLMDSIQQTRELISNLAAATVDKGCLLSELQDWLANFKPKNLDLITVFDDRLSDVDPVLAGSILFVLREALGNAQKHARANIIFLAARWIEGNWVLVILDNGVGVAAAEAVVDGFGLRGIRIRSEVFAGQFRIVSSQKSLCEFKQCVDDLSNDFPMGLDVQSFQTGTLLEVILPGRS